MHSKGRRQLIGFSQKIRLEWIEEAATLATTGADSKSIRMSLRNMLKDKLSVGSNAKRGSREKTISILMKIWVTPPRHLLDFHQDALKLFKDSNPSQHVILHWGMSIAVYPFFGTVALHVGRLLRLQRTVRASQVLTRVKEQYGDTESVSTSARKILRTFVDWNILKETKRKGMYTAGSTWTVTKPELIAWIIESYLYSQTNGYAELRTVTQSPIFFLFNLKAVQQISKIRHPRIEFVNHDLSQQLVYLKNA